MLWTRLYVSNYRCCPPHNAHSTCYHNGGYYPRCNLHSTCYHIGGYYPRCNLHSNCYHNRGYYPRHDLHSTRYLLVRCCNQHGYESITNPGCNDLCYRHHTAHQRPCNLSYIY